MELVGSRGATHVMAARCGLPQASVTKRCKGCNDNGSLKVQR